MERTMSATEARVHFGEVLDGVVNRADVVYVKRGGRLEAVIVSVEEWKHCQSRREDPWEKADRIFRESDEYMRQHYPPGTFADLDVDRLIDEDHEERDRAILGDLLR